MSDPVKKGVDILKKILEKVKKNKSLQNVMKKVDVDGLKKKGGGLASKLQSSSGIDASKLAASSGRRMKFPYTFSGKAYHFPYRFYINNNWMWKYYFIAVLLSLPVFKYIGGLSNAPENVKRWKELKEKEKHEHH